MHFFTISEIQNLCKKYGLRPSRDYGQNYLLNPEPIEAMLAAAEIKKIDTIVEVGPGFGALTFALAESAKKVIAFEIEKKIKPYWDEKIREYPNVEIVWGNILYNTEKIAQIKKYKVIANIPYQITSPIIKLFLEDVESKPVSLTLMVQKEVAQRICAKPGDMSVLAVAVQYFAEPEIVASVPRHYFYPVPEVDSAVIKIMLRDPISISPLKRGEGGVATSPFKGRAGVGSGDNNKQFFHLVKTGFFSRRKILIKNLLPIVGGKSGLEILENFWKKQGWSRTIRAQELSVTDWGYLFSYLAEKNVI